ncbi:MAG: hypothetical protein EZS28_013050 [Streblomastix strix]|uniref:Uncharacterized protein n=1 Tax=Streblomastix strix TaxID=222440 RepID=A0A5J4W9T7_9EUKA|nr:MAG: hypothetical protein EZS28_013050 [Streblomastix strix]
MGFFSGLKNFESKILGGIKKVAGWVAPTLHKVMGTLSGPVSMLHPGAGQIMGTIETLGKEHNTSEYEVLKIFEALIDDKELDDDQNSSIIRIDENVTKDMV